MERRINQANSDRKSVHGPENADKIPALKRKKPVQCLHTGFPVVGENHFLDGALPFVALLRKLEVREEHVLRTAQTNALCAELTRFASVLRRVRVGADAKPASFVGPLHNDLV